MMLKENYIFLSNYDPELLKRMRTISDKRLNLFQTVKARNGSNTIEVNFERPFLLHSKYNPEEEAYRLIEKIANDIESHNHIVVFGIGLGYHLNFLLEKFPNISLSIFEPNEEIFLRFLEEKKLTDLSLSRICNLNIGKDKNNRINFIASILNDYDKIYHFALPSYERNFEEEYLDFYSQFKKIYEIEIINTAANIKYQKRWTINSLINLIDTFRTPNFLSDFKDIFINQPVILVSAGPSLDDEIENLRLIQEKKSAYIFAAGSAIKTLLKEKIVPHGIFTYDPKITNEKVFEELLESEIKIPIIFASSVGYETICKYNGPKIHFFTKQDTISTFFLNRHINPNIIVNDNFSIAIIAYEILAKVGFSKIILVGQNFAYRNDHFYASGIKYGIKHKTLETEKNPLLVKSVDDKDIVTNKSLYHMRIELEKVIKNCGVETINTTIDGAKIEGSKFIKLSDLKINYLMDQVALDDWYNKKSFNYSHNYFLGQVNKMIESYYKTTDLFYDLGVFIEELSENIERKRTIKEKDFSRFDSKYKNIASQDFYKNLIFPMNRVQFDRFRKKVVSFQYEKNLEYKMQNLIEAYRYFAKECQRIMPMAFVLLRKIFLIHDKQDKGHRYLCSDSIFTYKGDYRLLNYLEKEFGEISDQFFFCFLKKIGSKILFNFVGKKITILGGIRKDFCKKLLIKIDSFEISTFAADNDMDSKYSPLNQEVLISKEVEMGFHSVQIELLDERPFLFEGIIIE